ncbi:MAG TPA: hypothetical protein VER55_01225, partial [Ardenticatenaceae bacterium]|nr:hypothetical protein [Ardenticatenaceae bacterium]
MRTILRLALESLAVIIMSSLLVTITLLLLTASGIAFPVTSLGTGAASQTTTNAAPTSIQMATAVAQLLTALSLLLGHVLTRRTIELDQVGQAAERFAAANTQLAARDVRGKQIETRLGAIYALDQIGRDFDQYRSLVVEVLTAYGRHNAPWIPEKHDSNLEIAAADKVVPARPP